MSISNSSKMYFFLFRQNVEIPDSVPAMETSNYGDLLTPPQTTPINGEDVNLYADQMVKVDEKIPTTSTRRD